MLCKEACPYNTLRGCNVKLYRMQCPFGKDKPKSNADCVRELSDEQLAEFIVSFFACRTCPARDICRQHVQSKMDCREDILAWLKCANFPVK